MNRLLPLFIGFRYSRSKRRQFFISFMSLTSMLGIALGVTVLITVLSVMNGFDEEIEHRIFSLAPHILITTENFTSEKLHTVENAVKKISQVTGAAPYFTGRGLIKLRGDLKPLLIQGIDYKREPSVSNINSRLIGGKLSSLIEGKFNVMISAQMAGDLGIFIGDQIIVMVPTMNISPFGATPRYKRFTVNAIFSTKGGLGFESSYAYINIKDAQKLFVSPNTVTGLRLQTTSLYIAPKVTSLVRKRLSDDYYVWDWTSSYGSHLKAIKLEKTMMLLILVLLIVIAIFNLVSSLVMLVNEKQSDIAILRTMGAKPSTILSIFIVQGSMIGIIGTALGVIGGIALATHVSGFVDLLLHVTQLKKVLTSVYLVEHLPSKVLYSDLGIICSISLVFSFLATIYPAWRASRLHPVQTLKYE